MEIVLVKWEDAFGCPEGWQMLDEVERETSLVQSVGFVAAETETTLTIVPHVGGLNRETQQAAGAITLPKRQIISVCRCEVAPPPAGQSASGGSSEPERRPKKAPRSGAGWWKFDLKKRFDYGR